MVLLVSVTVLCADVANSAAAAGGIVFFIAYVPYIFLQQRYDQLSWTVKMVCCLLSNVAMSLGCQVIGMFEGTGMYIVHCGAKKLHRFIFAITFSNRDCLR